MTSTWQPPRDYVGYGGKPPDPRWPDGARMAINFVMNYEEGSEASVLDGDETTDVNMTEAHGVNQPVKGRDLAAESMFAYGSRVGFWRLMRIFQERGVPVTIFACALALERNPPAAQAIRAAGFDVASHGWRWLRPHLLSEQEERSEIRKAIVSLERTVGQRPQGWYCRYGPSLNTRRLLAEEGGFLYDSDSYADELPYWEHVAGQRHLVVPYSLAHNDGKFVAQTGTASQWFEFIRDGFDMLYRESATRPRMMSVGMHMRLIGNPSRAVALERLLDHLCAHRDLWIARRIDIAKHWHALHGKDA
ncbi:MAG TPA: allantoinase PuuE [Xanthobacteraceae bacterium]